MRILLLLLSFAAPLLLHAQPAAVPDEIKAMLSAQEQAWNQGNGVAFADTYTPEADFVNIRGEVFHGRAEIATQHVRIFSGPYRGSHNTITVRQFTMLAPDIAMVDTVHYVTGFKELPPGIAPNAKGGLETRMKYIAVRRDGHWQFIAGQNTVVLMVPPHA